MRAASIFFRGSPCRDTEKNPKPFLPSFSAKSDGGGRRRCSYLSRRDNEIERGGGRLGHNNSAPMLEWSAADQRGGTADGRTDGGGANGSSPRVTDAAVTLVFIQGQAANNAPSLAAAVRSRPSRLAAAERGSFPPVGACLTSRSIAVVESLNLNSFCDNCVIVM